MRSIVWSEEESSYLKAMLAWDQPAPESVINRAAHVKAARAALEEKKPLAEFRVLVVGAKGTGKTSILTRFCQGTFADVDGPQDPFYERGCRHAVDVDGQRYMIDALEMPSKHLSSDPLLISAIQMTEGAILIYDVSSPDSLRLAQGIQELIRETVSAPSSTSSSSLSASSHPTSSPSTSSATTSTSATTTATSSSGGFFPPPLARSMSTTNLAIPPRNSSLLLSSSGGDHGPPPRLTREYAVLLAGNKADLPTAPAAPYAAAAASFGLSAQGPSRRLAWAEGSRAAAGFGPTTTPVAATTPDGGTAARGGATPFVEVSARTGDNVQLVFEATAREIARLRTRAAARRGEETGSGADMLDSARFLNQRAATAGGRHQSGQLRQHHHHHHQGIDSVLEGKVNLAAGTGGAERKRGLWRRISRPFFRKEVV